MTVQPLAPIAENEQNGPFAPDLPRRHRIQRVWQQIFRISTITGMIMLGLLLLNITNNSMGYVIESFKVDPASLAVDNVPLEEQPKETLLQSLEANISKGRFRQLGREKPFEERSREEVLQLVYEEVIRPTIVESWKLYDSLFHRAEIRRIAAEEFPASRLYFRFWLRPELLIKPQASKAEFAGIRTAILGSLWIILITILVAFPVGISAAIYLEEYITNRPLERLIMNVIQTNINNLAGVPSIIYGMLGLTVFVRALEQITSGAFVGYVDPTTANGRTILSAGLTMALLVLPLIIINAQEAIRAVPLSLRQASFGLGATRWQTVWHHVLPSALPGILTGTILAISRAMGETAPLVVVGASTFITFDPENVFSKFTTLPVQIYQWTARPQEEFRHLSAATIIFMLVLLLSLNAFAIILRNRTSRRLT